MVCVFPVASLIISSGSPLGQCGCHALSRMSIHASGGLLLLLLLLLLIAAASITPGDAAIAGAAGASAGGGLGADGVVGGIHRLGFDGVVGGEAGGEGGHGGFLVSSR